MGHPKCWALLRGSPTWGLGGQEWGQQGREGQPAAGEHPLAVRGSQSCSSVSPPQGQPWRGSRGDGVHGGEAASPLRKGLLGKSPKLFFFFF